jgi:hypothetical protein
MSPRQRRYSWQELARRGDEIYEQKVRPLVEEGNRGKVVAIDVDSGAFEVANDRRSTDRLLYARVPNGQLWYVRIGAPRLDPMLRVPPKEADDHLREPAREGNVMPIRQCKYPSEEFARRGEEIYEQNVRPLVEEGNLGKIVAIDIDTGAFEVDEDQVIASNRLIARFPDAQPWHVRIGYPYVDRIPFHRLEKS